MKGLEATWALARLCKRIIKESESDWDDRREEIRKNLEEFEEHVKRKERLDNVEKKKEVIKKRHTQSRIDVMLSELSNKKKEITKDKMKLEERYDKIKEILEKEKVREKIEKENRKKKQSEREREWLTRREEKELERKERKEKQRKCEQAWETLRWVIQTIEETKEEWDIDFKERKKEKVPLFKRVLEEVKERVEKWRR